MLRWFESGLCVSTLMVCCLCTQAQTTPDSQLLVAEETVLFAGGDPEPWSIRTATLPGGQVQLTDGSVDMLVTMPNPNSGGGCSFGREIWFDPTPLLTDLRMELVFKPGQQSAPQHLQMVLRTLSKKRIHSQWQDAAQATAMADGWQRLLFQFTQNADINKDDPIISVMVLGRESGQLLVHRIATQRLRNLSLQIVNPVTSSVKHLQIQGKTIAPQITVSVKLFDANGHMQYRQVQSHDGLFSMSWPNPPLSVQAHNILRAKVGNGTDPMDNIPDMDVFGYQANTDHLWLHVKCKQIITSPRCQDGEKPFVATGIGYGRDVIIPAYDEQVAAYCKAHYLNTIRLPINSRYFNNRLQKPVDVDKLLKQFIDPVILAAKRHGLYVIVDEHSYFSDQIDEVKARQPQFVNRWDEKGIDEWIARWVKIAAYYKNEPYVMGYELCNEPHDIDPQTVRQWYGRCIAAIRQVDTRHIVFVGTRDWSHSRALEDTWGGNASSLDAPQNNVAFAFHEYPTDNDPWDVQKYITQFRDR